MPVTVMAAAMAERLRDVPLTYAPAGQTAGVLPPGYRHIRTRAVLGCGGAVFTAATTALLTWQAHLQAGLHVSASSATAEPGSVVLLSAGPRPLRVRAPCRVVYVIDEPARQGFAYGTFDPGSHHRPVSAGAGQLTTAEVTPPTQTMIMASFGRYLARTGHDHGTASCGRVSRIAGRPDWRHTRPT